MQEHDPQPRIHPTSQLKSCRLGRHVVIGERVILREVQVGDYSYFERHGEAIYSSIGKFCSIATNVRINALDHPLERVTTHKVTYRPNEFFKFRGVDEGFLEERRSKKVTIGNDVWIGHGAVILPGVAIGHGAAIGANAVVTRNVANYAIVAGSPAREIRRRFDEQTSTALIALAWWDWPDALLAEAVPDMQTMSAADFVRKWTAVQGARIGARDDDQAARMTPVLDQRGGAGG